MAFLAGEHHRAVLGDGHRLLEVRGRQAVARAHEPSVGHLARLVRAQVDHRLDGQDARGLRFRGVPEVAAHKYRRFPGQVAFRHLQVVPPKLKAASIILSDRGIAYHIQYFLPIGESIEIPFDNRFFDYTTKRNFIFLHIHKKP